MSVLPDAKQSCSAYLQGSSKLAGLFLRRQTTFGASPHGRQDLAARPEVHRGRFSTVLLDLELDLLTFVERAQSGALDGGDMHEDIPASICGLNETIALLRVEPLHRAARHCRILQVSDQGLIVLRRRQANTGLWTRRQGCRGWDAARLRN
jgi:hypothetical protein